MPLIAASNRDEFFARPAAAADWWMDHPHVFAGRDLRGGGAWIGITRDGRFGAVTNVRGPDERRPDARSRGELVAAYLAGSHPARDYVEQVRETAHKYNGFNLLVGDSKQLYWYSNRGADDPRNGQVLEPGVYGLSNHLLDTPWPKVVRSKAQFASLLCQGAPSEAYFEMLTDTSRPSDCRLPDTGVGIERERLLSPICIESPDYGTRVSTVVQIDQHANALLRERFIR